MPLRNELTTVRARLLLWFAAVLTAALVVFSAAVYLGAVAAEAAEVEPEVEKERELRQVRERLALALLISTPAAVIVAAAGAYLLSRRALRVLGRVVHTANQLGIERLAQRIKSDPRAGREVEGVVSALNAMLERIDRATSGLRRFTADAAHELRTPLAILASDIEVCLRRPRDAAALRDTLESTLEGLGRLAALVEILLTLARSDAGELPVRKERVDLDALLARIAEPYLAVAAERQLRLVVTSHTQLCVQTDPLLLGRAVANLLDNACKFTPAGGLITLHGGRTGSDVAISITDDGPGLSGDPQRAFERFYRGSEHRGSTLGFGLGLSLVREFSLALGGTVELKSKTAAGTQVVLRLPA